MEMMNNTRSNSSATGNPPQFEIWYWSLRVVISLLTLLGNTVVILLIVRCPRLRVTPNIYICTLALADIFVGAVITPTQFTCAYIYPGSCSQDPQALVFDILIHLSVTNLCALTFDRYMAVVRPLQYQAHLIKRGCHRRVGLILFIAWFSAAAFPVSGFLFRDKSHTLHSVLRALDMAFFMFLPPFLLLAAYARMVFIARKHERKIKLQEVQLSFNYSEESMAMPKKQRNKVSECRERASIRMIGTVIIVFVLCYFLAMFRSLYFHILKKDIPGEVTKLSRLLLLSNCAVNFLVYAILKRDFRRELNRVCRNCCERTLGICNSMLGTRTNIKEIVS